MKKLFNRLSHSDQESSIAHSGLRFLTFLTLILVIPKVQYFIEFIEINKIPFCGFYISYALPFKLDLLSVKLIHTILIVTSVFSAVGLFFRLSSFLAFLSFSILILHTLSSCYSNHQFYPIGLVLLFWFINGTKGRFSIDYYLFKNPHKDSPQYIFKFLKIYFCLAFFFAGLSKLITSGLAWVSTDSLYNMISLQNYLFEGFPKHQNFYWLNQLVLSHSTIPKVLAVLAIIIELSAPLALFLKNNKWIIIVMVGMMQIGIQLIMYIGFEPWIILYYVWLFSGLDYLLKRKHETLSL